MAAEMIDLSRWRPVISDEAFKYLRVQRGKESVFLADRYVWEAAYRTSLIELYRNIAPHLPGTGVSAIDVGSGLGGIHSLIYRHYDGSYWLHLLDGTDAPAVMRSHSEPFSSFRVARSFLGDNGIMGGRISDANHVNDTGSIDRGVCSLIVSFQAWCFHFQPSEYLGFIKARLHRPATLILDVRKSRQDWRAELEAAFGAAETIAEGAKFERLVFHAA